MRDGTGKYRVRGAGGKCDTAFVKDRSISFNIDERLYRDRGYAPAFDDLPWQNSDAQESDRPIGTSARSRR